MIVENHIQGMLPRARGQKNVSTKVTSMFLPDFVFVGCVCAVSKLVSLGHAYLKLKSLYSFHMVFYDGVRPHLYAPSAPLDMGLFFLY